MLSIGKGVSNCLTALPIKDFGFELSEQYFWDVIRLWYGWSIANLPTTCPFDGRFSKQNCTSYKKGGFVSIRHNDLGDLTAKMSEVYTDIEIEPELTPLRGEELDSRIANTTNEERLDNRARAVWRKGQQAF